jgi:hypothetical protein
MEQNPGPHSPCGVFALTRSSGKFLLLDLKVSFSSVSPGTLENPQKMLKMCFQKFLIQYV